MELGKKIKNKYAGFRKIVGDFVSGFTDSNDGVSIIAPEDEPERVASDIIALYRESMSWRQQSFYDRGGGYSSTDPIYVFRDFRLIEAGRHWDVYSRRKDVTKASEQWKHELVDDEIQNQKRIRKTYLTGNWHDFTVIPNIEHINDILFEERKRGEWGVMMQNVCDKALLEGTCVVKTVLDRDDNGLPIIKEMVCQNSGIFFTPMATSTSLDDGCWYIIHWTQQTQVELRKMYPDFDFSDVQNVTVFDSVQGPNEKNSNGVFNPKDCKFTKFYDVFEVYLDDDTLEEIPFSTEITDGENKLLQGGGGSEIKLNDNHIKHIKEHQKFAAAIDDSIPFEERTPDEDKLIQAILLRFQIHIAEHMKAAKLSRYGGGKRKVYPYGRKIVVIGNKTAEDGTTGFDFDWRKIFNRLVDERIPNSWWGRGVVEKLYNANEVLDRVLSRTLDAAITTSQPVPWVNEQTAEKIIENGGVKNDPTEYNVYIGAAPKFPTAGAAPENLKIYEIFKNNAKEKQGVSEISYGVAPTANASGDMVEMLTRSNAVILTGEMNQNLSMFVEQLMETRLLIMKQYFNIPKKYFINGKWKVINVSQILSEEYIKDENGDLIRGKDGNYIKEKIPQLEVRVKPNSNFPQQWEYDVNFAFSLLGKATADGEPLVGREYVLDLLSERYPELGRNSEYYKLSQATQIGLQVMEQQRLKAEQEQKVLKGVQSKLQNKGLNMMMNGTENKPTQEVGMTQQ